MDLKQRAKELGIKQKDLAAEVGVSEASMSKWLNREAVIPTQYLRLLAKVLSIDVEALLPTAAATLPPAPPVECGAL